MQEVKTNPLPDLLVTGIPEVDRQHRCLIGLLNDADRRLGTDSSAALADEISRELLNYALFHFSVEERLMAEEGYKEGRPLEFEAHLREHRAFSERVVELRGRLKAGEVVQPAELTALIRAWLVDHIQQADQKLSGFLKDKR